MCSAYDQCLRWINMETWHRVMPTDSRAWVLKRYLESRVRRFPVCRWGYDPKPFRIRLPIYLTIPSYTSGRKPTNHSTRKHFAQIPVMVVTLSENAHGLEWFYRRLEDILALFALRTVNEGFPICMGWWGDRVMYRFWTLPGMSFSVAQMFERMAAHVEILQFCCFSPSLVRPTLQSYARFHGKFTNVWFSVSMYLSFTSSLSLTKGTETKLLI